MRAALLDSGHREIILYDLHPSAGKEALVLRLVLLLGVRLAAFRKAAHKHAQRPRRRVADAKEHARIVVMGAESAIREEACGAQRRVLHLRVEQNLNAWTSDLVGPIVLVIHGGAARKTCATGLASIIIGLNEVAHPERFGGQARPCRLA